MIRLVSRLKRGALRHLSENDSWFALAAGMVVLLPLIALLAYTRLG